MIIDFNQAKQGKVEQEEQVCEHCSVREDIITSFLVQLSDTFNELDGEELNDAIVSLAAEYYDEVYDEAYEQGRKSAYDDIIGYAGYNIDQIDGVEEE